MTNTNPDADAPFGPARQPRRSRWRIAAVVMGMALVAGAIWGWGPARRYGVTGASYGARVACSCRYLGGRSLDDCHKDMEGAVKWVRLSEDPAAHSVTASYPLVASQTAVFREGWGCQLVPWSK